jgi:hypothetical protein
MPKPHSAHPVGEPVEHGFEGPGLRICGEGHKPEGTPTAWPRNVDLSVRTGRRPLRSSDEGCNEAPTNRTRRKYVSVTRQRPSAVRPEHILLGMLLAGSACTNDPNGETGQCSYNGTSHACE